MDEQLWARINSITRDLGAFKQSLCKDCKQQLPLNEKGRCDACESIKRDEIASARIPNGSGYIYVYDDTGKLVSEARTRMEESLGRTLKSHEIVLRRNNQRDDNRIENLMLGLKNGTPIGNLQCNHCGTVGDITVLVEEIPSTDD